MNYLVLRLSALGDVAMAIPVIHTLAKEYPAHRFTVVSTPLVTPLFQGFDNINFIAVEKNGRHKGVTGIFRLYGDLRKEKIDCVADLHDVLRTKLLRALFFLSGKRIRVIDKGRKEKRALIKRGYRQSNPLRHSVERYRQVFFDLGLNVPDEVKITLPDSVQAEKEMEEIIGKKTGYWIGIAPFSQHKGKQLPMPTVDTVIHTLNEDASITLFIFGAGSQEKKQVEEWKKKYPAIISVIDRFEIDREVLLMRQLDVMLTMDSSNMHLASLVGTRVVSVWGATHPYAGFYGMGQSLADAVEVELSCRPCSVYGYKPCQFGTYACMMRIQPASVVEKLIQNRVYIE